MGFASYCRDIAYELNDNKNNVLVNSKELFSDLEVEKNIHKCFYLFSYLLWNGYYSSTKKYEYSDINEPTFLSYDYDLDYTIFRGKGVCRHNAILLSDILSELNYISKYTGIRLNEHNIKTLTNIKRTIGKHLDHESIDDGKENHAVTLVSDKKSSFILDPTILCEFEVLKDAKLIGHSGKYDYDKNLLKKDNGIKKINNEQISITKEELIKYYKETENIIKSNKDIIEYFYNENKKYYNKINKLSKILEI